MYIQVISF